jgi:hypothetical protein
MDQKAKFLLFLARKRQALRESRRWKFSLCLSATLFTILITGICLHLFGQMEVQYSDLEVETISGVVIDVEREYQMTTVDNTLHAYTVETIELENGQVVDIPIGGASPDKIGAKVQVYSDSGTNYEFSARGVALDRAGFVPYLLIVVPCVFIVLCLFLWGFLKRG